MSDLDMREPGEKYIHTYGSRAVVVHRPSQWSKNNPKGLPGRNDLCMCNSGKKYKKCCG